MPNYVTNKLKISGNKDLVRRIKSEISSVTEDGRLRAIDFHKVRPLPNELKGTISPMKTLTQEEYDAQESKISSLRYNTEDTKENEKSIGISRGLTEELQKEYKRKFKACDWYDWQTINWGTKWNASEAVDNGEEIHFLTVWSTPVTLIKHLSEKYPDAEFNVRYADEDFGYNVGEYGMRDGMVIHDNIPDGGTEEAYFLAGEIQDPSYLACLVEGIEENEVLEKYAENYIRAAYRGKIFGDYPKYIWNRLEEFAVADEDYEMAQKIKEFVEAGKV